MRRSTRGFRLRVALLTWLLAAALAACGGGSNMGASAPPPPGPIPTPTQHTDVVTYKNDLARTGQNLTESVLTLTNVSQTDFGLLRILAEFFGGKRLGRSGAGIEVPAGHLRAGRLLTEHILPALQRTP